ncbi:hypothetical protein [Thermospira aquatica]|uniref:PpiC domain-containing protein n=1 Tax=Thermospira aquatica TaxID=2828656 RepID=A0AAX3BCK7_9SPIR|nr:hypothetical protein [Thermospira aquatica]URA10010.1 hypothetical protein KDW03_11090 [Thermospira aquatica]
MASASEKRKELVKRIRYAALVLFTSLIIISFVISLAYNPFESHGRMRQKLVKVNGKWFLEGVDTGFGYWYDDQKNRLQAQGVSFDKDIESLFYQESIKNYAKTVGQMLYVKRLGVKPSDFFYTQLAQAMYRSSKPTFGEREFLDIWYTRDIFLGSWGEIQNTVLLSPVSVMLLYQDTKALTFDVDVVFTEKTNFVARFIQKSDLEEYFRQNITNFVDTLVVDIITVTNKAIVSNRMLAQQIFSNVVQNGWEKAIASLPGDAVIKTSTTVTREKNPRIFEALGEKFEPGLIQRTVFENKQYHVIRVQGMTSFDNLSSLAQQRLLKSYLALHFNELWSKNSNILYQTLDQVMAAPMGDWKSLVANQPFGYVHLPKLSLVDIYAEDAEGNVFPYALTKHPEILQFLVSSATSVKRFEFDGVYLVLRKNGVRYQANQMTNSLTSEAQYYILSLWESDWQKATENKTKVKYRKE